MATALRKKGTPSRAKRTGGQQQQFFDVGKVGRITGITLADTGLRDEHGMEPIDNIFSSPASPQRRAASNDPRREESSGPDRNATLTSRKTPRLPPPRASTPKRTNIGSPKRMSTGRPKSHRQSEVIELNGSPTLQSAPPANRVLDFGTDVVYSTVETSPFRPRHNLRRSTGARGVFASPGADNVEGEEVSDLQNDSAIGNSQDDIQSGLPEDEDLQQGIGDDYSGPGFAHTEAAETSHLSSSARRSVRRSRDSASHSQIETHSPVATATRKRTRLSLEEAQDQDLSMSHTQEEASRAQKRHRSNDRVDVHQEATEEACIDPALLENPNGDDSVNPDESVGEAAMPQRAKGKGKGKRGRPPKERDPNRAMQSSRTSVPLNDKPSRMQRGGSVGPSSNFALRATTPHEDAGAFTRSGRPIMVPLKYWANERKIYKHGVVDGIIRADEVDKPQRKGRRTKKKARKTTRSGHDDEDSDAESLIADEWEADVGVITGDVANWDPSIQAGDPHDLIHEDLAHAELSLEKREVGGGSNFRYSKILTLPFFGVGVLELPPGGIKSSKNCKKFQLAFFVHKGKVMAEVNPPGDAPPNQFAITKGGVWIVPRGNDYSIMNESSTSSAVIYFSQGSEVEAKARS